VSDEKPPVNADKIRRMEVCCRDIAKQLQRAFDQWAAMGGEDEEKWGFALFVFSFSGAEMTYISNAQRPDMVKALQEFIARNIPAKTWDEQHG
jgi:hypothetical protein